MPTSLKIQIANNKQELGAFAATQGAIAIREVLVRSDSCTILVATGASQFEMLAELVKAPGVDWSRITAFHLDEYAGMSSSHPASFRRYLKERFVDRLPQGLKMMHYVNGEGDPQLECKRLGALICQTVVDVAFVGIGENAHLAFNDPPANFETREPFLVVNLDEACRRQQLGEGWFKTLDEVPRQAISMSCREIMRARRIICSVPDERKALAVQQTIEGPISPMVPASILQQHPDATLYLDPASASRLKKQVATGSKVLC